MSRSLRVRIRRWHRSLGAIVGLGAIWLVGTGVTLNHAPELGLDQPGVDVTWVQNNYNISFPPPTDGWKLEDHWIVGFADKLYFNDILVTHFTEVNGVAEIDGIIIAAAEHKLALLDSQGEIIEILDRSALPGRIYAIAANQHELCLKTGSAWFCSDSQMLNWSSSENPPDSQVKQALPVELSERIQRIAAAHELTWERVIIDLHSGRFFGAWGRWIIDAIAIGLGLLALSGLWLWLRTQPHSATKR